MTDTRKTLGKAVATLRRARRWSQERLAEAAGVDPSYIARLETGRLNATLDRVDAIADALDVSLAGLVEPGTTTPKDAVPQRLLAALPRVRPEDVPFVVELAERLADLASGRPRRRSVRGKGTSKTPRRARKSS